MADAVLAEHVQPLALEPVAWKQSTVVIHQEPRRAAGDGPAAGDLRVEYCGSPAC